MKRICLIFFVILGLLGNSLYAQERRVSGTVTDAETGATLPGVTVMVQGTNIGTITDSDGGYELTVTPDNVLVFSFIGMASQEVTVGERTVINVALEADVAMLQEIVVTALGITRERKSLGYSVQEVGGEELARSSNPNLGTALSGKVAGLEVRQSSGMPGAPTTMFIRGARSFSGNNQPLYVVDGLPIVSTNDYDQNVTGAYNANRMLDIDPADIESISVLKGQAAAALYGLRASNGVILITTKSGRGAAPDRPLIQLSSGFSQDRVARVPEVQQTWAQGSGLNYVPVNSFSWGPKITDLPDDPVYGGNNHGQPGLWFHPQKNAWVEPIAYNNAKDFFENGGAFNNNISVSQAGTLGNYSVGLGSTHQTGIVLNTGMERYTGRFSGTMNLSPIFKAGFSGNVSNTSLDKLPSGNDSWLFTVFGSPPSYDLIGTPFNVPSGPYNQYRQISYRVGGVGENPLWAIRNNYYTEATQRFFGNFFLEADPASWINIRYQLGLDSYSTDQEILYQMGSVGAGQGLPGAAQYPRPENQEYAYVAPTGGSIDNFGVIRNNVNSLLNITLSHDLTDDLRGVLIVGNEFVHNQSRFWTMSGTGFTMPGWNNMSNTTTQTADESKFQNRTVGFYGNAALEFRDMLFLNLTGRQDIVSTMPRDSRTFFYPSVSLGWVFTELPGLQDNALLPFGKARISYAEVGQAGTYNVPVYVMGGGDWSGFISGISFPLGGVSGFRPSRTLYDPDLVPQNTVTLEFGLELRFLQNRIGLDYSYSDQNARDQIFAVPLSGSTGYGSLVTNAGEMDIQTHEIMLNLTPVKTTNFEWNFNTNFTMMDNVVVELAEGVENISLGGYVTPNIRASAGDSYPAIYGNQYQRDEQGRILVDENPDSPGYGMPLVGDFGKIGDVNPDFYMSFSNIFSYKAFSISAQLDWKQGGQMYSGSNRLMDLYGTSKATEDRETPFVFDGYKADGTPNDIERGGPDDPGAYQYLHASVRSPLDEAHIYGTSFVKLRDVTLSVDLPRSLIAPVGLRNASISFFARNFLLWTELPNFDPETAQGMGNMVGGMDYMSLPQTNAFGIGVNLTF
jgi:TonB-linked SusC/RagA family outer membrane protein